MPIDHRERLTKAMVSEALCKKILGTIKVFSGIAFAYVFFLSIPTLLFSPFLIFPAFVLLMYLLFLSYMLYQYKLCKELNFLLVEDTLVGIVEAERRHPIIMGWENAFYFSRYGRAVAKQDELRVASSGDIYVLALLGNRKRIAAFFLTKIYRPEKTNAKTCL